ncbi:MAG TPA: chitinase [Trebonia sp.]
MRRRLIPLALAVLAAAGTTSLTATAATATTTAANASSRAAPGATAPLPPHVFAPYFETYNTTSGGLAQLSRESGAKYLSLAFLQTSTAGSCTASWNGDLSTPVSATAAGGFGTDIAAIQRAGGNVIPSFGGYAADSTGTELADSCTSPAKIARVFEQVITTYHVSRIDLDVEANSLTDTAGIERRNQAIAETEAWAAKHHELVQFDYTIPVLPTGLTSSGLSVLSNAVAEHAKITEVNIMTFDYYLGTTQDMLTDTESAVTATEAQLQALYPGESGEQLYHAIGITEMPGIDDYGAPETFTEADAPAVLRWAAGKGLGLISFWALQRDNGGCPGTGGSDSCSGLTQPRWYFSHVFEPFSHLR